MNSLSNLFLRPNRLVAFSYKVLQHFQSVKCPVYSTPKLIISNSGCLVAGCCFSRQSDENTLLPNHIKSESSEDVNISNVVADNCKFTQSVNRYNKNDIENMKRKPECTDITVLVDDVVDLLEPQHKKTKTDETLSPEENVKQIISETVDVSPGSAIAGSSKIKEKEKIRRERPNYFVAVQISNDQIHNALKEVQDHILEQEGQLKRSMTKLSTLHITLMVMYIGDLETHGRALKALENVHREHDDDLSENPLMLEFRGLSHFQNRVLFAQLSEDRGYQRVRSLAESVKTHFAAESIHSTDIRTKFTPHLTVAKIEFSGKQKGIRKIDPSLYKEFTSQYFGSQRIESIQLLSMLHPKTETGYYSGDELYFSAFKPNDRINSLKKMLAIEERKKDIKENINKLMKENMKKLSVN